LQNIYEPIAHKSSQARYDRQKFAIEKRTLRSLKEKLELNKACIASADKGKTIVVLKVSDYSGKISQFINDNNFEKVNTDPTVGFQKQANQAIQSNIAIRNTQK
jgi:hypothetical protein